MWQQVLGELIVQESPSRVAVDISSGLDASIGFETDRPENEGTVAWDGQNFVNRTIIGVSYISLMKQDCTKCSVQPFFQCFHLNC